MTPETRDIVDEYWSDALDCSRETLRSDGVAVVASDANDTNDVEIVARGGSAVVAVAPDRSTVVREALAGLDAVDVVEPGVLVERLAAVDVAVDDVLGPAFLGYVDDSTLSPVERPARVLTEGDDRAYDEFRAACDDEWSAGGSSFVPGRSVGRFVGSELVALAGYEVWDDTLAHIAVVTHPEHRDEGHAQAVVSEVARAALDAGLVPQYRTLDAWPWSVAVATNLGFERWGTSVLVRPA
ncbi:hypothetical protein SAMN04487948_109143 [Halogranum amylolyticum]|uniref:N-acetyltransferase domain-containing protein n=1 Tax=Halogranum amylolyticum TaxID=660520 RepID=A0A1H8U583_9EURY|nr:GNAT family N-acetyltransferase [Halogranum amylolyticum]SEO98331.1 hypothetical protein SAMN04487948_109143 [Halogranum amylolyticum]